MAAFLQRLRERAQAYLVSNFTTTNLTATSTLLSFNALANEVWILEFQLTVQCSGTGGVKIAIGTPAGATVEGWYYSSGVAILTLIYQRLTAVNTLTATATHTIATTPGGDIVRVVVTMGANAGAVTLQAASVTSGQTTTIFAGSSLVARRAA